MYVCTYACIFTVNITEGRLTTLVTDNTHVESVGGSVEANDMMRIATASGKSGVC